ncbi:MAG: ECF transporter S component [Clostridia bacterium]|nr:ECF transporter S component [Clostridia bacterium]MDY6184435.1 ECF transporter S component [Eubacteriales bacterium]
MLNRERTNIRLRKMLLAALFVALAYISRFIFHFNVMFLTFEFKDAFLTVGGLILGPLWALGMSATTALIEFITISDTGVYGLLMNFFAATAFSCVASLVYRYRRTLVGAGAGLALGAVALVAVMIPMNLIVTPHFMGVGVRDVVALLPKLLLPFNAVKGVMNASVVLLLYKPITRALRATGLMRITCETETPATESRSGSDATVSVPADYSETESDSVGDASDAAYMEAQQPSSTGEKKHARLWHYLLVPAIGVLLLVASLLVFFLVLHGKVTSGK